MHHMTKTLTPPTRPPRLSVPMDADTLAVFERLAKAGNLSTGKAVAEWLKDTVDAAEYMAATMEKARSAPQVVIRELQAYTLGLSDELSTVMDVVRKKGQEARAQRGDGGPAVRGGSAAGAPPSCNTGGKLPTGNKTQHKGGLS